MIVAKCSAKQIIRHKWQSFVSTGYADVEGVICILDTHVYWISDEYSAHRYLRMFLMNCCL